MLTCNPSVPFPVVRWEGFEPPASTFGRSPSDPLTYHRSVGPLFDLGGWPACTPPPGRSFRTPFGRTQSRSRTVDLLFVREALFQLS